MTRGADAGAEMFTADAVIEAPLLAVDQFFHATFPAARARTGGDPRRIGLVRNPIGGRPRRECEVPVPAARTCRPRGVHRRDRHGPRRARAGHTMPLVQLFRIRAGTMPCCAPTSHQGEWTKARVASGPNRVGDPSPRPVRFARRQCPALSVGRAEMSLTAPASRTHAIDLEARLWHEPMKERWR